MLKKLLLTLVISLLLVTGCGGTTSENEDGDKTREFKIGETATINKNVTIKINEVKKVDKDCTWEYEGKCQSYTEPDKDYFLLIDLTIENKSEEDLSISSLLSFEVKDSTGEKGEYAFLLDSVKSQLDGTIMPNDLLKGQIAYDVKDDEKYNFYFTSNLLDNPIKFIINKADIK